MMDSTGQGIPGRLSWSESSWSRGRQVPISEAMVSRGHPGSGSAVRGIFWKDGDERGSLNFSTRATSSWTSSSTPDHRPVLAEANQKRVLAVRAEVPCAGRGRPFAWPAGSWAARSAQSGLGRATWRRSTATSWRSTMISASLEAWPGRAAPASQRPGSQSGRPGEKPRVAILAQPAHPAKPQVTIPAASSGAEQASSAC